MKISVAIPCYEMHKVGDVLLRQSLDVLEKQSFQDFEIIVSDHSLDDKVKKACEQYTNLNIKYFRNEYGRGSSSANANNCIKHSSGEIIKILCQDDLMFDEKSLELTAKDFDYNAKWLVTPYFHSYNGIHAHEVHYPHFSNDILFVNLIGTHSCLSILNEDPLLFDDNLVWYMDSDYYKRAYKKFGKPKLLKHPTVIQRLWDGQVTNTLINREIIEKEEFYLNEKYRAGSIII